jgi:hypothetical protein
MRKFLITAASAACMVAVVAMAPSALAANESAQLSSLDSGASISGSYSTTKEVSNSWYLDMEVRSPLFSAPSWTSVTCADYGITITVNGVPQALRSCGYGVNSYTLIAGVYADTGGNANLNAGDVITMTWGPGLVTSTGSLNGATVEVWRLDNGSSYATVTPTLASSSSSTGDAASVLMWQQAYGRASATDSCQDGYTPSWDTWPNGGTGGFVCNRFVPEYGN